MKKEKILKIIDEKMKKYQSIRKKAIYLYAYEMIENLEDIETFKYKGLRKTLLNGAENFLEYSMGGSSLIYDVDIAERLPKTYRVKDTHSGTYWLEVQADFLIEAYNVINQIILEEKKENEEE